MRLAPALRVYRIATSIAGAFAGFWLGSRARRGKEDRARLGERYGRYTQARPDGTLIWLHAASVGESGVALALIDALAELDASLSFLLSTGTRTSADLVARRNAPRTTHIYAPMDRIDVVRRFLAHWRPNLGVFVESELWPNLILETQASGARLALVNARMSPRSLRQWARWPIAATQLMTAFSFVSAADQRTADGLTRMRGITVHAPGNLKLAAPAPRVDDVARAALTREIGARHVWLAASTHEGEDAIALAAHDILRAPFPDALLIIAPRHPERGPAVARLALGAPQRSLGASSAEASVYVADTLGEMGLLYDLAPVALVAGSLLPHLKGHNPIEPAKLGAAIVTGPYVESFQGLFQSLLSAGGAVQVADAQSLADAIAALWRDEAQRERQLDAARGVIAQGTGAFEATVAQLSALAPSSGPIARAANASA